MPIGLPLYMRGTFLGSLAVAGANMDSLGNLTVSTTYAGDLHTNKTFRGLNFRVTNNMEDQSPSDVFLEDNVAISGGIEVRITEKRQVNTLPLLEQIMFNGFQYVRIQRNFVPPGSTTPHIYLAALAIADYDSGDEEKGMMDVVMTARSCAIPAFVANSSTVTLPF